MLLKARIHSNMSALQNRKAHLFSHAHAIPNILD